jgi:hypothetical protein
MDEERPFADVVLGADGFSIPELKWRELLFIGALRPDGDAHVRDPSRPLPAFAEPDLFPEGVRFRVTLAGKRIFIRRVA